MAAERSLSVVRQQQQATELTGWNADQIDLIKQHIAPGIPDGQLLFFGTICQRTGLDPFARQIYTIQRGGKWTIQTGIDGYRLVAARTGQLAGIDDAQYDDEEAEHPKRASVTVWRFVREQRVPFTATARWTEYAQTDREGKPTSMWQKMPYLMLAKCAEALALRKAFPAELSGVYTGEEMAQADNEPAGPAPAGPAPTPIAPRRPAPQQPQQPRRITREDVSRLANRLQVPPSDRKALMDKHGGDIAAVYAELQEWAATGEDPQVTFEEVPATLEGMDVPALVP